LALSLVLGYLNLVLDYLKVTRLLLVLTLRSKL